MTATNLLFHLFEKAELFSRSFCEFLECAVMLVGAHVELYP